jgi:hypothetical protein
MRSRVLRPKLLQPRTADCVLRPLGTRDAAPAGALNPQDYEWTYDLA